MTGSPPVCDYEGSDYRARFWEGQGRDYEDSVERIALRRLLPPAGDTLLEVGAGYGRLADEYHGYRRVVLFDYSRSLLQEARDHLGDDPRFLYVAGNWYQMPFVAGLFDTLVQVRTLHHAADVPALYAQLARIARPGGHYVLEFANKRNLKAIARHALGRQAWSPHTLEPVEFAALNFDFHPDWIEAELRRAGFVPRDWRTVSHFRVGWLKRRAPTDWLVALDRLLQPTGRRWRLAPSVFVRSDHPRRGPIAEPDAFFACPVCGVALPAYGDGDLPCPDCGRVWAVRDGLVDFKQPLSVPASPRAGSSR